MNIKSYLIRQQKIINCFLDEYLPSGDAFPAMIHQAMRYSVLTGGKRLRPMLVLASGEIVGGKTANLLPVAAAFELVHTYSLIHDDLPAMDNDDFRRGKPTSHKVFGEAIAILAGDSLLTLAFQLMAERVKDSVLACLIIKELSYAAGTRGMIGGQVLDIISTQKSEVRSQKSEVRKDLNRMHLMKTASLIRGAVRAGALAGGASSKQLVALTRYGENIGLAFQITDDLLDNKQGSEGDKLTYPVVYDLKQSKMIARRLIKEAKQALTIFGEKGKTLSALADYILKRRA